MRVAFYAPLKPPDSPVPSGDREMARQIVAALETAGHHVESAARLRSWDGWGDGNRQSRIRAIGHGMARRCVRRYRERPRAMRPRVWLTYHLYHKAPDWIGPAVAAELDIPYVVAEASYAPKQAGGKWAIGHESVAAALGRAAAVISLNARDEPCIRPLVAAPERLYRMPPFTDIAPFARAASRAGAARHHLRGTFGLEPGTPLLLAVAMMRRGDKLASYRILATALSRIADLPWQLLVVGDGEARREVEAALAPLGPRRVRFAGERPRGALPEFYAAADLLVWPACREAYGIALLEAQATGVPVVAGDSGGVPDIVRDGETGLLAPQGDAGALADRVRGLLDAPDRRAAMGAMGARCAARFHSRDAAATRLDEILAESCMAVAS